MLLFTESAAHAAVVSWTEKRTFDERAGGLSLDVAIDIGRHSVQAIIDGQLIGELIGPASVAPEGQAVSSYHLPPYYRWEAGTLSCRFTAEWRDGVPSIRVSTRHMQSLRRHPRALVVDDPERTAELGGAPVACIVMSASRSAHDLADSEPRLRVDWRGWHVVDVDDPFEGARRRILTTHTEVWC